MKTVEFLKNAAENKEKKGLPIISFPAVSKLNITVSELLQSAEYQARAMEYMAHKTDTLAAVSFMDLSLEAEALGAEVVFGENEVPAIKGQLISDMDEAKALVVPELSCKRLPVAIEAIRRAKELIQDKPVLARMIGPFSLAGRLMDVSEIMYICYDDPELIHTVQRKTTDFLISYAKALKEAGADGIVMAEPLCGLLNRNMAEEFSNGYVKEIIEAVQTEEFAVIYHNCGNSVPQIADDLYRMGASAYHFGNAVDMSSMLEKAPAEVILMGNLDPVSCFTNGTPEYMKEMTADLLNQCGKYSNFIISSGCDVPYKASWENIDAFYEAIDVYNKEQLS